MAVDKAVDSSALASGLTGVANAIRSKGGTNGQLAFPAGFVSAIGDLADALVVTLTGTGSYTADKTYAQIAAALAADQIPVVVHAGVWYLYKETAQNGTISFSALYDQTAAANDVFSVTSAGVWSFTSVQIPRYNGECS